MSKTQLKDSGIKTTKNKIDILDLFNSYKHLNVNQIYKLLLEKNKTISLSTIYRSLSVLEKKKVIIKHNFNDEIATYELIDSNEHHDHFKCIKCNKVIDFVDDIIEQCRLQEVKKHNFLIIHHVLILFGYCESCLNT